MFTLVKPSEMGSLVALYSGQMSADQQLYMLLAIFSVSNTTPIMADFPIISLIITITKFLNLIGYQLP